MSSSSTRFPAAEGPGSVAGAPNLPAGFTDTFTSRYVDTGDYACTRSSAVTARRCCWCTAGPRPGTPGACDAGAGPGLRGRRRRPARYRAVRQARGRLRHRHPRRRPGRADGRARPRAVRRRRLRHRNADQLRAGRRSPRPGRAPGGRRGSAAGYISAGAADSPATAERPALAHRLQPAREGQRAARHGTGRDLLRRGVRRLGRHEEAARRRRQVLRRQALLDPEALHGSFQLYRAFAPRVAQNEQRKSRR